MTGAMYAAIGGLKTHMSNLNVIGNNIANVNTAGYKDQRMTFQEAMYTTSKAGSNGTLILGGNNPSQIGYGAQVGSIDLNMSPGTFNPTGRDLDCMIEGDGFFMVGDKDMVINGADDYTKPMLTRVGNFWQDANGYICDRNGNVVYGFATVQNPEYQKGATEEEIEQARKDGKNIEDETILSTALVPLRLPLAAAEPPEGSTAWQVGDPVYNLMGGNARTPDGTGYATDDNSRGNVSLGDYMKADGTIDYDKLKEKAPGAGSVDGKTDLTNTTYTGPIPNAEGKCIQITGLKVTDTGAIIGVCDTGKNVVVGYAAIAKVMAPDGVTHMGGPYYKAQEGAGDITVGAVGGILEGKYLNNQKVTDAITPDIDDRMSNCSGTEIRGGGLEASTADVATEFSNMILTQRGYQANTRIVTVTDSMLEELVNMKR